MPGAFEELLNRHLQQREFLQQQGQASALEQQRQAADWQRLLQQESATHQENLQKQQFEQDQQLRGSNLITNREWASPQTLFNAQKNDQLQSSRKAAGDFYAKVGALPPTASNADVMSLAAAAVAAGVPAGFVSAALTSRRPAAQTPSQKYLSSPIGEITTHQFLNKDGSAPDPRTTVQDAYNAGASPMTPKDADFYRNTISSDKSLDQLLAAGTKVLPDKPGIGAATTEKWSRWLATRENQPDYLAYDHARTGLISYLRDLTQVGRISNNELAIVTNAFDNANTKQGLQDAVRVARQLIQNKREGMWRGGKGGPTAAVSNASAPGAVPADWKDTGMNSSDGRPVYVDAAGKRHVMSR